VDLAPAPPSTSSSAPPARTGGDSIYLTLDFLIGTEVDEREIMVGDNDSL
jgi:hypothetical protein